MEILMIDFLNPEFYDVDAIPEDTPNKPLLIELYERMNEQNERLWMFFTEMSEDPQHKRMTAEAVKPRTLRRKFGTKPKAANDRNTMKGRFGMMSYDEKESDDAGYKEFLANEFDLS